MEISESKDYTQFTSINGNRQINRKKIEKIVADIKSGFNMLPYCPIIVVKATGGGYSVIDGQHRLECSKITKNPVYFLEHTNITLKQIAQLNSRGEKWKATDFLNCYIKVGIKDYEHIKELMDTFKINIKLATDLLMFFECTASSTDDFQSGNFKSNYHEKAVEILTLVKDIFGDFDFYKDRYLIGAMMKIKAAGLCDFDLLKKKLKKAPHLIEQQLNVKSYIFYIEKVYNHGNHSREVII